MVFSIDPNTGGTVFVPPSYLPGSEPGEGSYNTGDPSSKPNYTLWAIYGIIGILVVLGIIRLTAKK